MQEMLNNEKLFEEIIVKHFRNMRKEIATKVQEAQRDPYRLNSKRKTCQDTY